jgi:hypothetical protein
MKKFLVFLIMIVIVFIGCNTYLSNDEIIREINKCYDNGMYPMMYQRFVSKEVVQIVCIPSYDAKSILSEEGYNQFIKKLEQRKK